MLYVTTQATVEAETGSLKLPRVLYQTHARGRSASDILVSSEAADGPRDAPLRPETYESWRPLAVPATWRIDLGAAKTLEYVFIAGHTIGSAGATIQAHYSNDDAAWTLLSNAATPAAGDDSPIVLVFPRQNARYVRLTLSGAIAKLAVIYVGTQLVMPHTLYGGIQPVTMSRETELSVSLSESGQFLGQSIVSRGVSAAVHFRHLDPAWVRASFDPFAKEARLYPYVFAWRALTYPAELAYVWTTKPIKPSNMGKREWMEVQWSMVGMGHD
jgi:hypothetical protein